MPNEQNQLVEKLPMVLTINNVTPNREFSFYLGIKETLIAIVLEEEKMAPQSLLIRRATSLLTLTYKL